MRDLAIKIRGYFFKIYLHILGVGKIGHSLRIRKSPIITIRRGGRIILGNNVLLNSKNRGYHVSMYSPMKFVALDNGIIEIGDNSRIHGTSIHSRKSVLIGKNCLIAANTLIMDSNSHELSFDNPEDRLIKKDLPREVVIGDNVWIGANVIILPGVHIGEGSVVGAGSVVTKDIPRKSMGVGNPFKVIKGV